MRPSWEPHQLRSQRTCQTTYISSHTIKTKSNQNIPNHCTTWTLSNFSHAWIVYHHSHSLIIHTVKTKEITTVKEVWICDLNYYKNLVKFCFDFLQELLMVWEPNIKHSKGCFIQYPSILKLVKKNLAMPRFFNHFSMFRYWMKHSSSCLVYYIKFHLAKLNLALSHLIFLKNNLHFIKYFYCIVQPRWKKFTWN